MPNGNGIGRDDTPITISDSSPLRLRSRLQWAKYDPKEVVPLTREVDRSVTLVSVMVNGQQLGPIKFNKQMCEVDITYGDIKLAVKTNPEGGMLRVRSGPREFATDYVHSIEKDGFIYTAERENAFISRVGVKQNGRVLLDENWETPGEKEITIHYALPAAPKK
jgi:hypothetical protein